GVYQLSYAFLEFETQSLEVIVLASALVPDENEVRVYVDGSLESSDSANATFKQVGQALQALKKSSLASSVEKIMSIRDGLYFEKLTIDIPNLTMIGESREGTILDYNQASGNQKPEGGNWGTQGSASVSVKGAATGLTMARMTISNSFPYFDQNVVLADRQAVALVTEADKVLFYQVDFYGVQDTLYAKQGRQ